MTAPFTGVVTDVEVDPATCTAPFATVGELTIATDTGAYAGAWGRAVLMKPIGGNSDKTAPR